MKKSKIATIVAGVIFMLACIGTSGFIIVDSYTAYSVIYKQEMNCVAKYISRGIERRDIDHGEGTCWVKNNGE